MKLLVCALLLGFFAVADAADERVNHAGRLLGPPPILKEPLLFNTPEADAAVSAMQIMPVDSPWNEDISQRPLLPNSAEMITRISADFPANRRTLRTFFEMNYVLVPDAQPLVPIEFFEYPDESDLNGGTNPIGLYPIPSNLTVETWPRETGTLTLSQWQEDVNKTGGDRHSIIVNPRAGVIWETWRTLRVGSDWRAANGAKFDLGSNALRPPGWTSADAAGLPMFPALVRYDECQRGVIDHALRIIVRRTRQGYIYPATHSGSVSGLTDPNIPAMGQRLRVQAGFAIPAHWTKEEKAVLTALKKYGAIVADNGNFFSISVSPDNRFAPDCFDHLSTIAISDFEVVETTGLDEGPRSPGAPSASAGPDLFVRFGTPANLNGAIKGSGVIGWKLLNGPGAVTFADPAQLSTTASFSHPGRYILALSVANGTHAVAYDAVAVDVILQSEPSYDPERAQLTGAAHPGS